MQTTTLKLTPQEEKELKETGRTNLGRYEVIDKTFSLGEDKYYSITEYFALARGTTRSEKATFAKLSKTLNLLAVKDFRKLAELSKVQIIQHKNFGVDCMALLEQIMAEKGIKFKSLSN